MSEIINEVVESTELVGPVKPAKKPRGKKKETEVLPEVLPEVAEEVLPEVVEDDFPVEAPKASFLPSIAAQLAAMEKVEEEETVRKVEPRNENVWGNVKILFDKGLTNKEVLSEIHEMYGNTRTSYACIAWYRNKYNKMAKNNKLSPKDVLAIHLTQFGVDEEFIDKLVMALK